MNVVGNHLCGKFHSDKDNVDGGLICCPPTKRVEIGSLFRHTISDVAMAHRIRKSEVAIIHSAASIAK